MKSKNILKEMEAPFRIFLISIVKLRRSQIADTHRCLVEMNTITS
jgi:hypothetical protein